MEDLACPAGGAVEEVAAVISAAALRDRPEPSRADRAGAGDAQFLDVAECLRQHYAPDRRVRLSTGIVMTKGWPIRRGSARTGGTTPQVGQGGGAPGPSSRCRSRRWEVVRAPARWRWGCRAILTALPDHVWEDVLRAWRAAGGPCRWSRRRAAAERRSAPRPRRDAAPGLSRGAAGGSGRIVPRHFRSGSLLPRRGTRRHHEPGLVAFPLRARTRLCVPRPRSPNPRSSKVGSRLPGTPGIAREQATRQIVRDFDQVSGHRTGPPCRTLAVAPPVGRRRALILAASARCASNPARARRLHDTPCEALSARRGVAAVKTWSPTTAAPRASAAP